MRDPGLSSLRPRRSLVRTALGALLLLALTLTIATPLMSVRTACADDPAGLGELERRIAGLTDRLAKLIEEANRDPREHQLKEYLAYSPELMKKRRKPVTASDIVEWMADSSPSTMYVFRQECKSALIQGTRMLGDYDLSADIKKQGRLTNRGYFYGKYVAPLLKDDDQVTRQLAQELLKELYGRMLNIEEIGNYDPSKERRATWTPAMNAWKKFLKKK